MATRDSPETSDEEEEEEEEEPEEEAPSEATSMPPTHGARPFAKLAILQDPSRWPFLPSELNAELERRYLTGQVPDKFLYELTQALINLAVLWLEDPTQVELAESILDQLERIWVFNHHGKEEAEEFIAGVGAQEMAPRYKKLHSKLKKASKSKAKKSQTGRDKEAKPSPRKSSQVPHHVWKLLNDEQREAIRSDRTKKQ